MQVSKFLLSIQTPSIYYTVCHFLVDEKDFFK